MKIRPKKTKTTGKNERKGGRKGMKWAVIVVMAMSPPFSPVRSMNTCKLLAAGCHGNWSALVYLSTRLSVSLFFYSRVWNSKVHLRPALCVSQLFPLFRCIFINLLFIYSFIIYFLSCLSFFPFCPYPVFS